MSCKWNNKHIYGTNLLVNIQWMLWLFYSITSYTQQQYKPYLYFDQYKIKEGFNHRQSRSLIQDKKGYIYITTENGLVRYNGHQFKLYRENQNDSTALQASYCVHMNKDGNDRLWIMAGPELQVFDPTTETFKNIKRKDKDNKTLSFYPSSFLYDKASNTMFIGSKFGMYYSRNGSKDVQPLPNPDSINDKTITNMQMYKSKLYGASLTGLYIYDTIQKTAIFHKITNRYRKDGYLAGMAIYVQDEANIYIGTWENGLAHYNPLTKVYKPIYYAEKETVHNGVLSLHKDKFSDDLWVGSLQGLYKFNLRTKKFTSYVAKDLYDHNGIVGSVNNFYYDNQNGLWICGEGLFRLDYNKQFISQIPIPFLKEKPGVQFPIAYDFERSTDNKDSIVWLQTYFGLLYRYNVSQNERLPLPKPFKKYEKDYTDGFFNLVIDTKNRLWYMTRDDGLMVWDIKAQRFVIPPNQYFNKKNKWAENIYEFTNGDIAICTYDGLYKWSVNNGIAEYVELNTFLRKNDFAYLRMIDEDSKGNIILARASDDRNKKANILRYNPITHTIVYLSKNECPNLNRITKMEYMIVNKFDEIFIGSYNGVVKLNTDLSCSSVQYYNMENGLSNESIYHFLEAKDGNVWYSHDFGFTQYIRKNDYHQNITYYNSPLKLNRLNGLISPNSGKLYNGSEDMFEVMDLPAIRYFQDSVLYITSFKIDNKAIAYSGGEIVVSHRDFPIEIELSLLQYTNSDNNAYYYILNENKPILVKGNVIRFDKLSPDTYTLKLYGKNFNGETSTLKKNIVIKVLPPFYQTWWFQFAVLGIMMYSVYFYLKLKEKQKQKLLETKNNIARDLHDDMASNLASIKILSELAVLKNGENETMEKIKKNVDNIQENLHDIIYNLKNDKYSLDQLIDKIKTYLIERVEVLDIKLDFNIKIEIQNYELKPLESRNIFFIFKEVINNISKYSNATNVTLVILEDKNTLSISIQENGVGFDVQDTAIRGNGIDNMYSRAAEIKAKFNITSEKLNTTHNLTLKLKQ